MPVNRRKPEWRQIVPFDGITTKYGFESRTASGDQTVLGQAPIVPATDYQNLVIYPNNCQPHTATKKGTAGSSSGFISFASIATAQAAGWRVKWGYPPRQRRAKGTNKHIKVTLNGVDYAWIRPSDTLYNLLANFGHKTPAAGEIVWYGCQFPVPATLSVQNTAGQSAGSLCDPSKENDVIGAGGVISKPGRYTAAHLANMIVSAPAAP